jgi:lipopolysaccharide biosynthesis protein
MMLQPNQATADFVPYSIHRTARLSPGDDVLVFVAYCPQGLLSPLHIRQMQAYEAEGYCIALVVNSGADDHALDPGRNPAVIQIVRENIGFDFGGWGHGARLIEGLNLARSVTFANDSVVGPLPGDGSSELRQTVQEVEGDAVFMTESLQIRPHGQSYFFAFKRPALDKGALSIVQGSLYFSDRKRVVLNEEITLASRLQALGISVGVAFPCPEANRHAINPTFFFWDYLVSTGFPFVKVSLIPDGRVSLDDPELEAIIGAEFLECLRKHLSRRPIPAPLHLEANPSSIRR